MHHRISISLGRLAGLLLVAGSLLFAGVQVMAQEEDVEDVLPVGDVSLRIAQSTPEALMLDVGLAIFDPGIPLDESSHSRLGIFPEIRKAEAKFMPVLLREALMESNAWGVVRVLPEEQSSSELLVTGNILESNGSSLLLRIRAQDATGRVWLDRLYRDRASERDYLPQEGVDPYDDLYRQIANDLYQYRLGLDAKALQRIREVALLRYAASLSEDAFGSYLQRDAEGIYQLVRLPAQGDPMLERVQRIRNQEHLFVDTVDEQYVALYEEMVPTYHLWRQYGRERSLYLEDYESRAQNKERAGRRGSFAAMEQTYNTYKLIKIQEQDLDEMAQGFNNEVTPTVMEASGRVFRLSGTLDTQYKEWRDILRQIFILETGLPADS